MGHWIKVLGNIKIFDIKKQGYKDMFNLKTDKALEKFFNNSNYWKHYWGYDNKHILYIDLTDSIKKYFRKLDTPYGSEGNMEMSVSFNDRERATRESDTTVCESTRYNVLTGDILLYENNIKEDRLEMNGWKDIMFGYNGNNFVINVYGALRDTNLDKFKQEFDNLLALIDKNFCIEDVFVRARDDWESRKGYWTFSKDFKIQYKEEQGE